jgi:putative ABC transport system permease protein
MKLFRRLRYWLHARQNQADLTEEMEFHRAMLDGGAAMGNATLAREDARAVWIWPWLESVMQDLRYALRNLRAQPAFAIIAILALGCSIGLNTSLFTVFNAIAIRPWPVHDPARVVNVFALDDHHRPSGFSLAEVRYFASQSRTFSGMLAQRGKDTVHLEDGKAACSWVTGSYFSVLGVGVQQGRGFLSEEDNPESPLPVAVVSDSFWQTRLGSDPRAVGRQIRIEDVPFTIVGVTDGAFTGTSPEPIDIYVPMAAGQILQPRGAWVKEFLSSPNHCCSNLAGRLLPGISRKQGEAELTVLHQQFQTQMREEAHGIRLAGTEFIATGKKDKIYPVFALMGVGVLLVLLLACANVGNLLLARAAARRREISVRVSLGASRSRLVRQLLTESMLIAMAAGAFGVVSAFFLPTAVFRFAISEVLSFRFTPDTTVLTYALVLSAVTCVLFGLAPALNSTRPTASGARSKLRSALLAAQVALSVILLVAASLLARGIQNARAQDPGFKIADVSIATFELPASSYDAVRTRAFFTQLTQELKDEPLGLSRLAPLGQGSNWTSVRRPGENEKQRKMVLIQEVSAGYFGVLNIPVRAGRNFEAADADRKTMLVNETFAKRFFDSSPETLGKTIVADTPYEIVGVVKDAYTRGLDEIAPTIYLQISANSVPLALFPTSPGEAGKLEATLKRLEPRARLSVSPLSDNLEKWLQSSLAGASIAAVLGAFALVLAVIGMFGVFAFWVEQRTPEIGVRMALGARPVQVIRLVLSASSRAVLIGLVIGFGGAVAASRLLVSFLFGVSPLDPLAYAETALILAAAGLLATYVPARRATKIDPMTALRCE